MLLASLSSAALVVEPVAASAQSAPPNYGQNTYGQNGAAPTGDTWPDAPPPGAQYAQAAPPSDPGPPPPPQYANPPPQYASPPQYAPAPQYAPPPQYAAQPQSAAPPQYAAQPQYAAPPQYAAQPQYAAPPQYAPPPQAGGPGYYAPYQSPYADNQARYNDWSAHNCAKEHNSSTAAGAIFGGAAGALMGFSLAGWAARGFWTVFGGTVGASLGAVVGSSTNNGNCQNGYAAWSGPPAYAYAGPAPYAAPAYAAGPGYRRGGWVWAGDHWAHRHYGYGGWRNRPAGNPYYRY